MRKGATKINRIHYQYQVDSTDFTRAGEASSKLKQKLKQMNLPPDIIRRCAIAIYEGEINMVIHANGGVIDVDIFPNQILMVLKDVGPGIPDIGQAMQEGFSTANDEVNSLGFGAGMGLPNMKRSSDEIHIDTELDVGTTVTMRINF
ncbi:MAG: anti-sigma regulatory factor [Lachnospiraceae bacterium]|nr:anti-sigma regulatory factor [Lachnospiraceae bacterium]